LIGLDLGSKYIKACTVVPGNGGSYTAYAAMTEMSDDKNVLTGKIKHLLRQLRIKNKDTFLSVGGIDLLSRDFSMPKINRENIEKAVMYEAENSVFETLDDMYSDYQVLSSTDDKMDVLFAASPRKNIVKMMEKLSLSNLNIAGVNVDNIALTNAFVELDDKRAFREAVVLVNIGDAVSNISIVDKGVLRFIRNVAFGGKDVTCEIASIYETDIEVAEQIKRQPVIWDDIGLNIKNILKKSSSNLLEAIFRSMEYCVSRQKIGKVDRILLTGGGAVLRGIDNFIFDTLGIITEKWNPLKSDKIKCAVDSDLGCFAPVVLGLALTKGDADV
jgi:type IV pilus assembly protein PilM